MDPDLAQSWSRRVLELRRERLLSELQWIDDALRNEREDNSSSAKSE